MIYKIITKIPKERYVDVLTLIHESFEEHKRAGLNFTCSNYTIKDVETKVLNGYYFIAIKENDDLLGITSVSYNDKDRTAYENITAIAPSAKGHGVGSALYKERTLFLKSLGCISLLSDTATKARSSVQWHLKKCHCRIVDYRSFSSTNYYSYIFKEDFVPITLLRRVKDFYSFIKAYVYCRLFFTADGTLTRLGKIKFKE